MYPKNYYERRIRFSNTEKGKQYRSAYFNRYVSATEEILYSCGNISALNYSMHEMTTLARNGKLVGRLL